MPGQVPQRIRPIWYPPCLLIVVLVKTLGVVMRLRRSLGITGGQVVLLQICHWYRINQSILVSRISVKNVAFALMHVRQGPFPKGNGQLSEDIGSGMWTLISAMVIGLPSDVLVPYAKRFAPGATLITCCTDPLGR